MFSKTRVPIKILFDYLKNGDTIEEFVHDFPSVRKEQVIQLLVLLERQYSISEYEENIA